MEELYYQASESDFHASESDMDTSENDINVSESDTEVSETDAIHSNNLNSRKLDTKKLESSNLETSEVKVSEQSPIIKRFLSKSSKEQNELLNRCEANKTIEKDLRSGKEVMMTKQFEEYFANN